MQVMENMQTLTNLQELWLGRNRIKSINLCGLKCIKKLSLQSNRLTSMKGLEVDFFNKFRIKLLYGFSAGMTNATIYTKGDL